MDEEYDTKDFEPLEGEQEAEDENYQHDVNEADYDAYIDQQLEEHTREEDDNINVNVLLPEEHNGGFEEGNTNFQTDTSNANGEYKDDTNNHSFNSSVEDHSTDNIDSLKKANKQLRAELAELNRLLDEQLAQKGVNIVKKAVPRRNPALEKELKNAMKQIEIYKRANEEIKKQYSGTETDRITYLENQITNKNREIDELKNEIKGLVNIQREQSKALESNDAEKTIKTLHADYRVLKLKHKQVQDKNIEFDQTIKRQHKRILELEAKCGKMTDLLKSKNITADGMASSEKARKELEEKDALIADLERRVDVMTKAAESERKRFKVMSQHTSQEIAKLKKQIEDCNSALDEKDKELKMTVLQLRDIREKHGMTPQQSVGSSSNHSAGSGNMKRIKLAKQSSAKNSKEDSGASEISAPARSENSKIPRPQAHRQSSFVGAGVKIPSKPVSATSNNIEIVSSNETSPAGQQALQYDTGSPADEEPIGEESASPAPVVGVTSSVEMYKADFESEFEPDTEPTNEYTESGHNAEEVSNEPPRDTISKFEFSAGASFNSTVEEQIADATSPRNEKAPVSTTISAAPGNVYKPFIRKSVGKKK